MIRFFLCVCAVSLALAIPMLYAAPTVEPPQPVIVAYVFPRGTLLQPGEVDVRRITRINFAFANIAVGHIVLGSSTDEQNLVFLTALRKENPSLTVLVSVGGWLGSGSFSDIALTAQSRRLFAASVIAFLKRYDLDGLDVDWEYPGMSGAHHRFRPDDKQNFTLLLKELRTQLDRESQGSGKKRFLTIAAGASDDYLAHTEMSEVECYVDTVNLMSYDYAYASSDPITSHHAPLFTNPAAPNSGSAHASVVAFERAGVPSSKIVLGVPFYGHLWGRVSDLNHGLFQAGKPASSDYATYGDITSKMLNHGFTRYWDPVAFAPYLYSEDQKIFVSYEDPESLAAKCRYILADKLAGIMFWEYSGDPSGKLLQAIDNSLHLPGSVSKP